MKRTILLYTLLFVSFQGYSQFNLYNVFPSRVSNVTYGDTLINAYAVLKQAGIKKIATYQISSENIKGALWATEYFITNGRIDEMRWYLIRARNGDTIVRNYDTLSYDSQGRFRELKTRGKNSEVFAQAKFDYPGDNEVTHTWITLKDPQKATLDTSIYRCYFDKQGRPVRQEQIGKPGFLNASFYYNADGLLDSIPHDDPKQGTYIFTRKQKGRNKIIELETPVAKYKWVCNSSGQWLSSEYAFKSRFDFPNQPSRKLSAKVNYYYNADGTLSKVVEDDSNGEKLTTFYSYDK
jgi:hypothetical protein